MKENLLTMKKLGIYAVAILMLCIGTLSTGCFGKFSLTRKLYKLNDSLGDKWINTVVFWGLAVFQVYTFCGLVDTFILNVVEFWTGSNPISMGPNDKETQTVMGKDGQLYEITATQNRFDIVQLTGAQKGTKQSMLFNPSNQSCSIVTNGVTTKVAAFNEATNTVKLFRQDGSFVAFDANADIASVKAAMQSEMALGALNKTESSYTN